MSRLSYLFDKYLKGDCSKEEYGQLMELLQQDENESQVRAMMKQVYDSMGHEVTSEFMMDSEGRIVTHNTVEIARMQPNGKPHRSYKRLIYYAVAACIAGLICLAGWNMFFTNPATDATAFVNEVSTNAGSKTSVVLPDGTKVHLNYSSSLKYGNDFSSGKREVVLSGEAFFDVKHDDKHPFIIHTENFDVADLGTVFNIKAYPGDEKAEAALISGSIAISMNADSTKKFVLQPNEKLVLYNPSGKTGDSVKSLPASVYNNANSKIELSHLHADSSEKIIADTAWLANKLMFNDEVFKELALQMERRYNVTISFENQQAGAYRFTGRFEDESVDEALEELQAIASFKYHKNGNSITIF